ncbi:MAG: hypothetical protein ACKOKB_11195, partial [Bacteroidota bacterium]
NEVSYHLKEENQCLQRSIDYLYPREIKVASWESLFSICRKYRKKNKLSADERVVLLTDLNNEHNWFSAADINGENNFFVHSDQWEFFLDTEDRFPVAYLIATGILKKMAFNTYTSLNMAIHHNPKGCISDFCENKREIILKMRTADICSDCMQAINNKGINRGLLSQCFQIMEHIRTQLLFRERFEMLKLPSRIVITPGREPIRFIDMDNSQLRLAPLEKAVFILFLKNPEGLHFNRLSEHREQLKEIYLTVGHNLTLANLNNTLDIVTDPTENRLSEIVSKMRNKFSKHVGHEMAEHYAIDGPRGNSKKIKLDRSLVVWDAPTS